ncbi:hypothetical protein QBC38DRAFT_231110 [Podospora fimiseda]|uniref:Uncharacterized protein n=1 Tax=Podospora fimiseda TaxID=252190 RepID=A0AAN7BNX7_9PEZI|nr:hypothetical protein QBC38DRAFT_231110 [Podospora fimiseda]
MAPIEPREPFDGNDFSNNLFTDLSPILALFGEQVTKQFLSLSLCWADNILLAMGPIGIFTIVVSAIRVGGGPMLKAIVGRDRKEKALVEQELLSSTSDEVCEMWNGSSIVRTRGKPPPSMKTLILNNYERILSVSQALDQKVHHYDSFADNVRYYSHTDPPPDLTLNLNDESSKRAELNLLALFGVLLQTSGLVVAAITEYRWKWKQSGIRDTSFAYPCYLVGSVLLFTGVLACGHIIEDATRKTHLV